MRTISNDDSSHPCETQNFTSPTAINPECSELWRPILVVKIIKDRLTVAAAQGAPITARESVHIWVEVVNITAGHQEDTLLSFSRRSGRTFGLNLLPSNSLGCQSSSERLAFDTAFVDLLLQFLWRRKTHPLVILGIIFLRPEPLLPILFELYVRHRSSTSL